ncbi:hypothetical protein GTP58_28380 [Duganella sp. CY15W]|uniref:hypothetical protein n=1 Tax=Duganella sp. CY15W TaxID=2692172 RepID=UPI00136B4D18|nr:hypothetical protein [Duganella sp. CY15W]MYM32256.1 hypothetical protein [Duganella sp. CY15W]
MSSKSPKAGVTNFVLTAALIGVPAVFGYLGKPTEMTIATVACAIALAFAHIDKLESFKGAGFEAKMRDVLDEANATLHSLQNLARPLLLTNAANIAQSGRWHGIGREKEHKLISQLEALAKSLEIDDDEINDQFKDYYNYQYVDHIRFIADAMDRAHIKNEVVKERLAALTTGRIGYVPPTVTKVRDALAGLQNNQLMWLEPFVIDYEYYKENRKYRRPEAVDYYSLTDYVTAHPLAPIEPPTAGG